MHIAAKAMIGLYPCRITFPVALRTAGFHRLSTNHNNAPNRPVTGSAGGMGSAESVLIQRDVPLENFLAQTKLPSERFTQDGATDMADLKEIFDTSFKNLLEYVRDKEKLFDEKLKTKDAAFLKLYKEAIEDKMARKKWEETFNVRGALEHLVDHAKDCEKIGKFRGAQDGINKLLRNADVDKILTLEVKARGLRKAEVQFCLRRVFHDLSQDAHGHGDLIVISSAHHGYNRRAGLIALMKAQDSWKNPMKWQEQ
ncbi:hypothetical protein B9Z19DRAFT_1126902 [Tuber borchii]|uniref:Uncharacterized protein n=1 Tax=Tuber borchii TaxID=42251 RepID=A0A2T6ZS80_TUBBO|nr:hypothetical protein B9Z19DRAFT_1126902 [Tuber borchii]